MSTETLPLKPSRDGGQPETPPASAQVRARAREAAQLRGISLVSWVATGVSPLAAAPPSLLAVWALHTASAKFYGHWWARWPRYGYGAVHTWLICPPGYLLAWATDSPPKLAASSLTLVIVLRCFGVHILWSWL